MRVRRKIDGMLLLDKPLGLTSNAALQRAKRVYGAAKAGHGGTLDPLASGLLPLLFGEATKFAARMLDSKKSYRARVKLGETTATGDAEGPVLVTRRVAVDQQAILSVLERFRGSILQVPPMYSALKRDGRPLYELARAGQSVERAPRKVEIHRLELRAYTLECIDLDIECSKGTYIRALATDIGDALGSGAHLAALQRTAVGRFSVAETIGMDALEAASAEMLGDYLLPLESLFQDLPRIDLDSRDSVRFGNGQALQKQSSRLGLCGVFSDRGAFIGLATCGTDGALRPHRLKAAQAAEIVAENQTDKLK